MLNLIEQDFLFKSISLVSQERKADEKKKKTYLILFFIVDYFKDFILPSFMHADLVFLSPETMRLLGDIYRNDHILLISIAKDQQRILRIGLLWPNSLLADNQVALSRTVIDQLFERQMIELRTIPKDQIRDTDSITLRYSKLEKILFIHRSRRLRCHHIHKVIIESLHLTITHKMDTQG